MNRLACLTAALMAGAVLGIGCTAATQDGPESSSGFAPRQPQPEQYGAKGDGRTDDYDAITNCLGIHGVCVLGPRTYLVRQQIVVPDGAVIQGKGRSRTIVKLADNCAALAGTVGSYSVFGNSFLKPSNNVRISGLAIDCNFNGQRLPGREAAASVSAISLWGTNNLIENVRATGFQAGTSGHECFVLYCALGSGQGYGRGSTVRGCEVTGIASNRGARYGAPPIVTCVANGGGQFTATNAVIENCWIHDLTTDAQDQQSQLHGLTSGGGRGAFIRNNVITNFYGNAIYQDTWRSENLTIISNRLMNVRYGIYLMAPGGPNGATYDGVMIANNVIRLAGGSIKYDDARPYANQQRAINLYNQPNYKRVVIRDNSIGGRSWGRGGKSFVPEPYSFGIPETNRSEISLQGNRLDFGPPPRR